MTTPQTEQIDLTVCELEPIKFPGAVQPHGAVLVLEPGSENIHAASESCESLLGRAATSLLGQSIGEIIGNAAIRQLIDGPPDELSTLVRFSMGNQQFFVRAHRNEAAQVVLDIEAHDPDASSLLLESRQAVEALRQLEDIREIADSAAKSIRLITGFDRVMVYRFDEAWNGEVIAEACTDAIESYLGLNFPASDIPRQARELFKMSKVRQIPNVEYVPSSLVAPEDSRSIDLGTSSLRSVSPIHIEYCANMGVRATLVGSLVVQGKLWGLIACHHMQGPKCFGPGQRDAIGWLCQDIANLIEARSFKQLQLRQHSLSDRRRRLVDRIRQFDFKTLIFQGDVTDLLDVVGADGFALLINDEIYPTGITPEIPRIRQLLDRRRESGRDPNFYATSALVADLGISEVDDKVAGAVFVAVAHKPANTMIWFRQERRYSVRWAGDPALPHVVEADGRITPRKSFELFLKNIHGQSLAWSPEELASAAELGALIEINALRASEAFNQTVLDSNPEHICVLDARGTVIAVNRAWIRFAEANGATDVAATSVGVNYRGICAAAVGHPSGEEAGAAWAGIEAVIKKRRDYFTLDYPCHSPTQQRWFQMSVYPMNAPVEGVVVSHLNVTERKLAELSLAGSEKRYRGLLEDQTEIICRFTADGTILYVNDAFCRYFGKEKERLIGSKWQPEALPDDLPLINEKLKTLSPDNPVITIENRVVIGNADIRWGQFVNRAFFDERGQLLEIQAVGRDITERKSAEEGLREALCNVQDLYNNAPSGYHSIGADGSILDINDTELRWLGYERDELVGCKKINELLTAKSVEAYQDNFPRFMANGNLGELQLELIRKDGTILPVLINATAIRDAQGNYIKSRSTVFDLTEKLRAETQLNEAQRIAHVGSWEVDLVGNTLHWSGEMCRIHGVSIQAAPSRATCRATIHPDDQDTVEQAYREAMNKRQTLNLIYRVTLPNLETRNVHVIGETTYTSDGTPLRMAGTAQDITEVVRSEEILRFHEARLQGIFDALAEGLVFHDKDGKIIDANPAAETVLGLTRDELLGRVSVDPHWEAVHEDGTPFPGEQHPAMVTLRTGQPMRNQVMGIHSPRLGSRWININSQPILGPQSGSPEAVLTSFTDITERQNAAAQLNRLLREQEAILASKIVGIAKVAQRQFIWSNSAVTQMLGYSENELVGHSTRIIYANDLAYADMGSRAYECLKGGRVFRTEAELARKDGSLGWFSLMGCVADGGSNESIWMFVDISERKAAEAELSRYRNQLEAMVADRTAELSVAKETAEAAMYEALEAHERYLVSKATREAALESMADAVFISDNDGRFIDFNDAFATFHRFENREQCAKTLAEYPIFLDVYLPSGELLPLEQWAVSRALRGESANNVEFTLLRKDTGETWIGSYNYAPIRDEAGVIIGSVVTGRDITEQKKAELALIQAKDAAEGANRAKNIFLATMSHELRTPLNAIMGMTELAMRRVTDPKQGEQLNKVKTGANNLLGIIKDILDISRIEADRLQLQDAEFSLDHVLASVTNSFGAKAAEKGLGLAIDVDPELAAQSIRGDRLRLGQVLINLTGNAIKFTAKGSVTLRVLMTEERPDSLSLRFAVEDTGIGIANTDQQRIFEAFEQADGSSTRNYGGTGLGLTICKRLIQLMGGEIHLDSQVGVGSTFWFVVRFDKVGENFPALPVIAALTARRQLQDRHDGAYILVAEDDPLNRDVAKGLLEEAGLVVQLAEDGAAAVAMAKRTIYDLILMDLQMPVMDGLEATRQIRNSSHNPAVPIIALTANVFPEDEASCREAGMNDFIGRPVESEALYKSLLKWLDRKGS